MFQPVDRLTDGQIDDLVRMYQAEWWTEGRKRDDVRHMVEHSDLIIGFSDPADGRLVAFARVLTDYVYKALIFDVIADRPYRNQRLGRALMDAIVNHSLLTPVRHLELYCLPELVPFYRNWGFTDDLGRLRFMRLSRQSGSR